MDKLEREIEIIELYFPIIDRVGSVTVCFGDSKFECLSRKQAEEEIAFRQEHIARVVAQKRAVAAAAAATDTGETGGTRR